MVYSSKRVQAGRPPAVTKGRILFTPVLGERSLSRVLMSWPGNVCNRVVKLL